LTLVHSNVPDEHTSYEEGGWESNYFEPMKTYFSSPKRQRPKETNRSGKAAVGMRSKRPVAKKRKTKLRPKVAMPRRKKAAKSAVAKKKSKARRRTRR